MSMGTVEPIGGVDTISFIRGAAEKYQGSGHDDELLSYIEELVGRAREAKGERRATSTNSASHAIALLERWASCWTSVPDGGEGLIADTRAFLAAQQQA